MNKITCICCKEVREVSSAGQTGQVKVETGWGPFFDCSNGLGVVWVCQEDLPKVAEASDILRNVFGNKLEYIHMIHVARLSKDRRDR